VLKDAAKTDWFDALEECEPHGTTWKDWKTILSYYIVKKILPENAYRKQVRYMEQRFMPAGMSFKDYTKRLSHSNLYLPFMLMRDMMEEVSDGEYKALKQLWVYGLLRKNKQKEIYLTKTPKHWIDDLDKSALGKSAELSKIVEYFER